MIDRPRLQPAELELIDEIILRRGHRDIRHLRIAQILPRSIAHLHASRRAGARAFELRDRHGHLDSPLPRFASPFARLEMITPRLFRAGAAVSRVQTMAVVSVTSPARVPIA